MTHHDAKPEKVPHGPPPCAWCGEPVRVVSLGVRLVGTDLDGKPRVTDRAHACPRCWHRYDLGRTG